MNGFRYDLEQKKITIEDCTSVVMWKFVEKETASEASKMLNEAFKNMDVFLLKKGCKRCWGNKSNHI